MSELEPIRDRPVMTRRRALAAGAGAIAAAGLAPSAFSRALQPRRRTLRFAHMTDVHVQPERGAGAGFAACLHHAQTQPDAPELIVFGGDNVMDVAETDRERARVQMEVWNTTLRNECSLPHRVAIGNHDVLGLTQDEGKRWATDAFGLDGRYASFDRAGWRFVLLDSVTPVEGGYKGRLDDEQFDWLGRTLRDTPPATPVVIITHIPILAVSAFFDGTNEETGDWRVPGSWMHVDARRLKNLFRAHPGVKLCLSGHLHLVDRSEYLGVTYCCNGAVSGGWWKGNNQEFGPGYALVDLYDDGSFENRLVPYPWEPRP